MNTFEFQQPKLEKEKERKSPSESLGKKIFNPVDVDGVYDKRPLDMAREMHEMFEKEKGYVGLMIFGSSVQGFYSNEKSDLDLRFLYDSSLYKEYDLFGKKIKEPFIFRVDRLVEKTIKKESAKHGKEIHIPLWFAHDINPKKIAQDLSCGKLACVESLAELVGLSVGDKIEDYRNYFKRFLQTLPVEMQVKIKNRIIELKLKDEKIASEKRILRNSEFSKDSEDDALNARRELWVKRVEKIYGI